MINKIICVLLLILFIILVCLVYSEIQKNKFNNNIENFQLFKTTENSIETFEDKKVDKWGDSQEEIDAKTNGLNNKQKKEVDNRINTKVDQAVKDALGNQPNASNASVTSQSVEPGPTGPAGGEYIASGLLLNKKYSTNENNEVDMSVTRAHGEGDSGKSYMEVKDSFSPSNSWYLYKDGNIKNRLDEMCLTTNGTIDTDLYMSECSQDPNQLWNWDRKSNRLVLASSMSLSSSNQKCIGLTGPKRDENTLLAGCAGKSCGNPSKRFLKLKNCNASVNPDEVWAFKNV